MTAPIQDLGRIARRRREHERQVVIFTILAAFLFASALYAVAVFTGAVNPGWHRDFTGAPEAAVEYQTPCLPDNPGLPYGQPPLPHDQVMIRVLNAAGLQGIASAFEDVLAQRGFDIYDVGSFDGGVLQQSELRFGREGIVAAYTLAGQFDHIKMVLDDRPGPVVDLLAGRGYAKPIALEDVQIHLGMPMSSAPDCVNVANIEPIDGPNDLVWPPPAPEPETDELDEDAEAAL